MVKLTITYTSNGELEKKLEYKGEEFSYGMTSNGHGLISDKETFEVQVENKFKEEPEEALELLDKLDWTDDEQMVLEILELLSEYEG